METGGTVRLINKPNPTTSASDLSEDRSNSAHRNWELGPAIAAETPVLLATARLILLDEAQAWERLADSTGTTVEDLKKMVRLGNSGKKTGLVNAVRARIKDAIRQERFNSLRAHVQAHEGSASHELGAGYVTRDDKEDLGRSRYGSKG